MAILLLANFITKSTAAARTSFLRKTRQYVRDIIINIFIGWSSSEQYYNNASICETWNSCYQNHFKADCQSPQDSCFRASLVSFLHHLDGSERIKERRMIWRKEHLDLVLVPTGLLIMSCYHLFLLYRCLRHPETTNIGYENHCRKAWVERMLQIEAKDRGQSLTVISSTISAATFLASTSLALCSLIGAWVGNSSTTTLITTFTYGDTSPAILSIKYISILACFLLAMASFLHSIRSFVHAIFLISMPNSDTHLSHVEKAVIHGGLFWTMGLRAIYFAATMLLCIFGPIPMFVCSVTLVWILHTLDSNTTPLHQFKPVRNHDNRLMRKLAEERPHMDASRTQGSDQK